MELQKQKSSPPRSELRRLQDKLFTMLEEIRLRRRGKVRHTRILAACHHEFNSGIQP